jgi:ribosomal 30S subunit maturation factor RimM
MPDPAIPPKAHPAVKQHPEQPSADTYRRVARYSGPVGLKGEVKLVADASYTQWLTQQKSLLLTAPKVTDKHWQLAFTKITHLTDTTYRGRLAGVNNRNELEALKLPKGALWAVLDAIPKLESREFWLDDVVGCTVLNAETEHPIATVTAWLEGNGDIFLELKPINTDNDSSNTDMATIPFNEHFFPTVETATQTIHAHPSVAELI